METKCYTRQKEKCKQDNLEYRRAEVYQKLLKKEDELKYDSMRLRILKNELNDYQNIVGTQTGQSFHYIKMKSKEEKVDALIKERNRMAFALKELEVKLEEFE